MNKKIRIIGAAAVAVIWFGLCVAGWFLPAKEISESERRKLAQFPELNAETLLNGKFMAEFEEYTLDQFPLRDQFRQLKALFHYNVLGQKDNNDIIIFDGYAAKQEYPLKVSSVESALAKFRKIYDKYLADADSRIFAAVVPDKLEYLPKDSGYLTMDYDALFHMVEEGMDYAQFVNLRDDLGLDHYYRTDTHWRQEKLLKAAGTLCEALDVTIPKQEDYTVTALERPFYGVYYGQAALPMEPEAMYILENDLLSACTVTNFETGKTSAVYDMDKLTSRDLYDVYLSGATALLTIDNPNAKTDRELIVFRDSFGSSMIPLLLHDYATVTVIDTRYVTPDFLGQIVDFDGQDVLFLYSTLVLNQSSTLK